MDQQTKKNEYQPDMVYRVYDILRKQTEHKIEFWMEMYNAIHQQNLNNRAEFALMILEAGEKSCSDDAEFDYLVIAGLHQLI